MILLTSTSDIIRVVTAASAAIKCHASWVDNASGTITPGRTNTASITTNTTTTIVASPGASTQRAVQLLNIRNDHASVSCLVTVEHFDGTNSEEMISATLAPGETLVLDYNGNWSHYDGNGGSDPSGFASREEIEGGSYFAAVASSIAKPISPGLMHYHPSVAKAWVKCGVTGNNLAGYNITSITDTGAGQATVNINVDFINQAWACCIQAERTSSSLLVTNLKSVTVQSNGMLIGSVLIECFDTTATTAVREDPTAYHMVGLGRIA